jgi:hypothetical protein
MVTQTIDTRPRDNGGTANATPDAGRVDPDLGSIKTKARLAGMLYLVIFVVAPFAFLIVPETIVVDGDAATTAANVIDSEGLFRAGMVAETIIIAAEIVLAGLLYGLLRPVSRPLSLAAAFARFGEAMMQAVNLFTSATVLLVLGGTGYLAVFEPEELDALATLFVEANAFGVMLWGLLFGFHLALLGYLVHRSGFWPRLLGVLLMVASLGYLAQSYGHIVSPDQDAFFAVLVVILAVPGELGFTIWLLWKGIDADRWHQRNREANPV